MRTTIIVFTGLPGTGKTTLSRQIADSLHIPLFAKDDIKEIMYDKIGWSDKAFSAKLANATFGIMDYITQQHLKNEQSIILESNYSPTLASKKFDEWQKQYDCRIVQVVCRTEVNILAQRYFDRQQRDRHPGHNDTGTVKDYVTSFHERIENREDQPLEVGGPIRIVDTTDFSTVSVPEITQWIRNSISD